MRHSLTRVVQWAHELLAEVVLPGDLAVDLTAGNGQDTLLLYRLVGETGQVIAFDIQAEALVSTHARMTAEGARVRSRPDGPLPREAGVDLLEMSHAELSRVVPAAPKGIIANLGYLPGGNRQLITLPDSTLSALQQACSLLSVGGRLAVTVYPGHPGGAEEGASVTDFFTGLCDQVFHVLQLQVSNRPQAPFLFVAEKLG